MIKLIIIIIRQYIISTLLLITLVESGRDSSTFFPRLPVGEFQVRITRISYCDPRASKIQIHWHLTKISPTKTEIEGNMTLEIPLDDSLLFAIHVDQRKPSGAWANDMVMVKRKNGCSDILKFAKKEYYVAFGYPVEMLPATCPFPPGVYFTKELPAYNWDKVLNLPTFLFYGTYRLRVTGSTTNNEQVTCFEMICDIMRPWESP